MANLSIVVCAPKGFKAPEQIYMPNGDALWTLRGFEPDTSGYSKDDPKSQKDLSIKVVCWGTKDRPDKWAWLSKIGEDFEVIVDGEVSFNSKTGNLNAWISDKTKEAVAVLEIKATRIRVRKGWKPKEKIEGATDGPNGEVPF